MSALSTCGALLASADAGNNATIPPVITTTHDHSAALNNNNNTINHNTHNNTNNANTDASSSSSSRIAIDPLPHHGVVGGASVSTAVPPHHYHHNSGGNNNNNNSKATGSKAYGDDSAMNTNNDNATPPPPPLPPVTEIGAETQLLAIAPEFEPHHTHLPPPNILNVTTPLKSLYHIAQSLLFIGCILLTFIFSVFETDRYHIHYFLIQQVTETEIPASSAARTVAVLGFVGLCIGLLLLWISLQLILISPRSQGRRVAIINLFAAALLLAAFSITAQHAATTNATINSKVDPDPNAPIVHTFSPAYGFYLSIAAFALALASGLMSYAFINFATVGGLRALYRRVDEREVLEACYNPEAFVGQLISQKDPNYHKGAGFKEHSSSSSSSFADSSSSLSGASDADERKGADAGGRGGKRFVRSDLCNSATPMLSAEGGGGVGVGGAALLLSSSGGALPTTSSWRSNANTNHHNIYMTGGEKRGKRGHTEKANAAKGNRSQNMMTTSSASSISAAGGFAGVAIGGETSSPLSTHLLLPTAYNTISVAQSMSSRSGVGGGGNIGGGISTVSSSSTLYLRSPLYTAKKAAIAASLGLVGSAPVGMGSGAYVAVNASRPLSTIQHHSSAMGGGGGRRDSRPLYPPGGEPMDYYDTLYDVGGGGGGGSAATASSSACTGVTAGGGGGGGVAGPLYHHPYPYTATADIRKANRNMLMAHKGRGMAAALAFTPAATMRKKKATAEEEETVVVEERVTAAVSDITVAKRSADGVAINNNTIKHSSSSNGRMGGVPTALGTYTPPPPVITSPSANAALSSNASIAMQSVRLPSPLPPAANDGDSAEVGRGDIAAAEDGFGGSRVSAAAGIPESASNDALAGDVGDGGGNAEDDVNAEGAGDESPSILNNTASFTVVGGGEQQHRPPTVRSVTSRATLDDADGDGVTGAATGGSPSVMESGRPLTDGGAGVGGAAEGGPSPHLVDESASANANTNTNTVATSNTNCNNYHRGGGGGAPLLLFAATGDDHSHHRDDHHDDLPHHHNHHDVRVSDLRGYGRSYTADELSPPMGLFSPTGGAGGLSSTTMNAAVGNRDAGKGALPPLAAEGTMVGGVGVGGGGVGVSAMNRTSLTGAKKADMLRRRYQQHEFQQYYGGGAAAAAAANQHQQHQHQQQSSAVTAAGPLVQSPPAATAAAIGANAPHAKNNNNTNSNNTAVAIQIDGADGGGQSSTRRDSNNSSAHHTHITAAVTAGGGGGGGGGPRHHHQHRGGGDDVATAPPIVFYEPESVSPMTLSGLTYCLQVAAQIAAIVLAAAAISAGQYSRTVNNVNPNNNLVVVPSALGADEGGNESNNEGGLLGGGYSFQPGFPSVYTEGWHFYKGAEDESPYPSAAHLTQSMQYYHMNNNDNNPATNPNGIVVDPSLMIQYTCESLADRLKVGAIMTAAAAGLQGLALLLTPMVITRRLASLVPLVLQVVVCMLLVANVGPFVEILHPTSLSDSDDVPYTPATTIPPTAPPTLPPTTTTTVTLTPAPPSSLLLLSSMGIDRNRQQQEEEKKGHDETLFSLPPSSSSSSSFALADNPPGVTTITNICAGTPAEANYDSLSISRGFVANFIVLLFGIVALVAGFAQRSRYLQLAEDVALGVVSPILEIEDEAKRLSAAEAYISKEH